MRALYNVLVSGSREEEKKKYAFLFFVCREDHIKRKKANEIDF